MFRKFEQFVRVWEEAGLRENVYIILFYISLTTIFFNRTVRRWSLSGDCVQIYRGHTNYVYR